jgi:hypothetical protein
MNEFVDYIDPFEIKVLKYPVKEANSKIRKGNSGQVKIVENMCKEICDLDLYSGMKVSEIEKSKVIKRNRENKNNRESNKAAKKVKNKVPKIVKNKAKEIYIWMLSLFMKEKSMNYRMEVEFARRVSSREFLSECLTTPYILPVKDLARLEYLLTGVDVIAEEAGAFDRSP